jgi:hypothetical protein
MIPKMVGNMWATKSASGPLDAFHLGVAYIYF